MKKILSTLAMVAMATQVSAATLDGVYSTHKEGCAWRKNQDQYPKDFEDIAYLSKDGIMGWEWGCEFATTHENRYGASVHVSTCGMEGTSWPDVVLVEQAAEGYHVITKDRTEDPIEFPFKCE